MPLHVHSISLLLRNVVNFFLLKVFLFYEIRPVNRGEFTIDISLSRGEQGFRFVFLLENP